MIYEKQKYLGFIGLISVIGLKGFMTGNYLWCLFFVNYLFFTFFYENSIVYKKTKMKRA